MKRSQRLCILATVFLAVIGCGSGGENPPGTGKWIRLPEIPAGYHLDYQRKEESGLELTQEERDLHYGPHTLPFVAEGVTSGGKRKHKIIPDDMVDGATYILTIREGSTGAFGIGASVIGGEWTYEAATYGQIKIIEVEDIP